MAIISVLNNPDAQGTSGADTIYDTDLGRRTLGLGGNDEIFGEGGNDEIFGNEGNDTIFGGLGEDSLYGGRGDAGNPHTNQCTHNTRYRNLFLVIPAENGAGRSGQCM